MKAWTLGRMCILMHSILALERAPNMYRTPSTSGEPLPAVRELSANCIEGVSIIYSDGGSGLGGMLCASVYVWRMLYRMLLYPPISTSIILF